MTEMAGRVGIWVAIQSVVPAAVGTQVTDQVLSWMVRAQQGVIQVASQLENMTKRPAAMRVAAHRKRQVVKQVTPQATPVWIQVSVQVRTQADPGHRVLPLREPTACVVVWILPARPALIGGLVSCAQDSHGQGQALAGSTPPPGGKSLSWMEN